MSRLIGLARAAVLMAAVASCSATGPGGMASPAARPEPRLALPASPLGEDDRIVHVLARLGYGPRPGDVERVRRIGLEAYIDAQLHPDRIPDDAVDAALRAYPTLAMTTAELLRDYPRVDVALLRRREAGEMGPGETREAVPPERRPTRILGELQAAKLVRAVSSERQLQEVMVDFWFNHFNVFAQKGAVRWMLTSYERDAIRPHALGRFRDLLLATARHPAMLFYLDNWLSVRPGLVIPAGPNAGRQAGLNENYARELMELHTLGVDGGYTQADVVEVARCFTGWSIDRPFVEGRLVFRPRAHDDGDKRVLGHAIPAGGGERDGVRVIEILSRHPATARFVASKLARRFVSDAPPPALVARAAETFARTDGDIRAVLETIVVSPEFFSAEVRRAKIKTPLEVVASAVRAVDGRLASPRNGNGDALAADGGAALARAVGRLGQPLYGAQPPTGYADLAEAWVNTGALVARMNFALTLAHGRYPGTRIDLGALLGDVDRGQSDAVLDRLLASLLHGRATPETRAVLARQLGPGPSSRAVADRAPDAPGAADAARLTALVLGSPEFQRR